MRLQSRVNFQEFLKFGIVDRHAPVWAFSWGNQAWWDKLPAERRAKPNAGITRERQDELLKLWRAKKA